MALKAGYYGVKKNVLDELNKLDGILPADVGRLNKLATQSEIDALYNVNDLNGAHNINGTKYISVTSHFVEFTVNSDGTVTANGTASGGDAEAGNTGTNAFVAPFDAQVILSGGVSASAHIYPYDRTSLARPYTNSSKTTRLSSSDNATNTKTISFWMEKGHSYVMALRVTNGTNVENIVFKPMLRLETDQSDAFTPYAQTNQELTASASDQKTAINAIIAAATDAADFAAFKTAMGAITPVTRSLSIQEPETREASDPEPEPETKTTKRSTKKTETTE